MIRMFPVIQEMIPLKRMLSTDPMQRRGILVKLVNLTVFCVHHYDTLVPILFLFFNTSYCTRSTQVLYTCYRKKENQHDAS